MVRQLAFVFQRLDADEGVACFEQVFQMLMTKNIRLLYILICLMVPRVHLYAQKQSVSDIVERAIPSVVQIIVFDITGAQRGIGSGFFIAPGEILTNAHVVEGAYSAEILSDTEYYSMVMLLKSDEDVDLALLSVDDRGESTLQFEEKEEIRPGQRIITIGNPMGLEKSVSDGLVSAIRGISGQIQVIQISAPISPGSSGGPVLNWEGYVIGVASAALSEGQNLNFAIGIETIIEFLRKPDNPRQLHEAKSRVLSRVILKWVVNIVVGLIVLTFGSGWGIVVFIVVIFCLIGWVLKKLFHLVTVPFRKGHRDIIENSRSNKESYSCEEGKYDGSSHNTHLFADIGNDEQGDKNMFTFHCWRCGAEVYVDALDRPDSVKCEECGTKLEVPNE